MQPRSRRLSVLALLATAVGSGAFVGLVGAVFIWAVEEGTELVWSDLPDEVGVDPFDSWWIIAVPVVGALLVGLCQRLIGDHPRPMQEAIARWRSGGQVPAGDAPRTGINALVILVLGGPVGFEAALVGLLGGTATFVGARMRSVGHLVRQAWGAEEIDSLPHRLRQAPYWLAALSSVIVFRWLPFGAIDLGFRFGRFDREWGVGDALAVFGFALVVTIPVALALGAVAEAEESTMFGRAPIRFAVGGAVLFALLAVVDETVLFSGQIQFQQLPEMGTGHLLYITVAKWVALLIALCAGWRGGPIFPMYTSAGALAVVAADLVDVAPDLLMVGALAAVSTVITKGSIPLALVLTVYVVPPTYGLVVLVGCTGAVIALLVGRSQHLLGAEDAVAPS